MADWRASLESVAVGLLSLEVNTIRKTGMSAQKMPDVPIALHAIVELYADYLDQLGYGVNQTLLTWAANRIMTPPPPGLDWHANLLNWQPDGATLAITELTNGARTFEALRWAAAAALRLNVGRRGPGTGKPFPDEVRAVITRICANCRQLSPLILSLQSGYPPPPNPQAEDPVLIDGTLEQTAQACFRGKPKFRTTLDVAVVVRKIWDIGTETVLLQTSVQVDGDVVTRISPEIDAAHRDFLLALHASSLKTGLAQWQALFNLVKALCQDLGKSLFGPR